MSLDLGARITYLGHSSFLLVADDGAALLLEPFVTSNPVCPESLHRFERLDAILCTHGHPDHIADLVQIFEECTPEAVVTIPEVARWLGRQGIPAEALREMNKGGTIAVAGTRVTMTHALHSGGIFEDDGTVIYGGEPAGFVIELASGRRVYHAGDTCVFSDMSLIGELYAPDLALLPIGDHYTMGPREAAKACELLGVRRVVPMHYGTWPILHGTPEQLREELAVRDLDVEVIAIEPGQSLE